MDMKPGTVSNMGTNPDPGYIDMSLSSPHVDKGEVAFLSPVTVDLEIL